MTKYDATRVTENTPTMQGTINEVFFADTYCDTYAVTEDGKIFQIVDARSDEECAELCWLGYSCDSEPLWFSYAEDGSVFEKTDAQLEQFFCPSSCLFIRENIKQD